MSAGKARLGAAASSRRAGPHVKFFRISQLRRLCECEKVAAVCYRVNNDGIQFLLVQTRGGRWTFPKGSVEPGLTHAQSAALEAYEEAGVHGRMEEASFSRYFRQGRRTDQASRRLAVNAHLCEVSRLETPPERHRKPTWFTPEDAKIRLRKGRAADEGMEMARIVGRAVVRIQRLRNPGSSLLEMAMLEAWELHNEGLGSRKKDALKTAPFSIVEHPSKDPGSALNLERSRRQTSSRTIFPLLRAKNS